MSGGPGRAWRNRLLTVALVLVFLSAMRVLLPSPEERALVLYRVVVAVGYGHLIGGAVFARRRLLRFAPRHVSRLLLGAFLGSSAMLLLALYVWTAQRFPVLVVAMLAVATWHTVENDLLLARAYRGKLELGPFPHALDTQLVALGASALVLSLGAATLGAAERARIVAETPLAGSDDLVLRSVALVCGVLLLCRGRGSGEALVGLGLAGASRLLPYSWEGPLAPGFVDFFAASTSYHLVSWLVFFGDRAALCRERRRPGEGRALWRRIAAAHLPALLFCAGLCAMPGLATAREIVFSPAIYLFWSVLHVFQTLTARGLGWGR